MSSSTKKKSSVQKWLDASNTKYGQGEGEALPTGNTREDKDILSVYENAAQNAAGIEKRAENAQMQANKAYDLTQKYLAAQNQANGMTGLGVSDTSLLRASSQYQQALADANATREQSLLENYKEAQEDVNTIRGEWASKEEAAHEEKLQEIKDNVLYNDNLSSVKQYLSANGIEEGSSDYNNIMSAWELEYGTSDEKVIKSESLRKSGVELDAEGNAKQPSIDVNSEKTAASVAVKMLEAEGFTSNDGIYNAVNDITKQLSNVIEQSRSWGPEKNGTAVDIVEGRNQEIWVFYDGVWYKSKLNINGIKNATGQDVIYVENMQYNRD